jgi:1-acyl-sn-glycerol-3-phosphate acyltransferase
MGLIGCWHTPLLFGVPAVVLSPLAFLAHPATWLEAISQNEGTISVGPNFAYQSCVDRVTDAARDHLDLSRWRVAISGSEPVSAASVERFVERFAACGFRREAMCPAYGLAEMGVGVAFTPLNRGPRYDLVDRATLQETGQARPAPASDPAAVTYVSCGPALEGYEIRVVGPDGVQRAERVEGEVECRGPSATSGYFGRALATQALWRDGWLDTGDLGYLVDGELFITGRTKDVVIRGGRKLHPEELEQRLGETPGIIPGGVAVIARVDQSLGTEQIVAIVETATRDSAARSALTATVTRQSLEILGVAPDEVVLVPPGAIIRTASGKIRRAATGDALAAGTLGRPSAPVPLQLARFAWSGRRRLTRRSREAGAGPLYEAYSWLVIGPAAAAALVISLIPATPRRRSARARSLLAVVSRLLGVSFEVRGAFPTDSTPYVVVANHSSFIDALALYRAIPEAVVFVTSTEIERTALVGPLLRRFGCAFVQRGRPGEGSAAVTGLVEAVRHGQPLVIFPEGSLSGAVGLRPFHLGAFDVAVATAAPIIPVGVAGTRGVLAPGRRQPRRGHIVVTVGEPLRATGSDFAAKVALRDLARRRVAELSGEQALGSD